MTTKAEAAEALYRAAVELRHNTASEAHRYRGWFALNEALNAYRDSTPTPLPAEVARVLEAAARWHYAAQGGPALVAHGELQDAIEAYCERVQYAQPEPLSTRLARLKPGSVVLDCDRDEVTVEANYPHYQELAGRWAGSLEIYAYDSITAIRREVS